MLRRVLWTGAVVGMIGTMCWAAPGAAELAGAKQWPPANTPLGRLISGSLGRLLVLRSELNLSAAQRDQIRTVLVSHKAQIAGTVKSVHDKRVALRNAVLGGKAAETQIRAAADDLGKAITEAAVKASKLRAELAPILTEEQRQQIAQFLVSNDAAVDKFLSQAMQTP
jgi:Spy/CpxP family protein refolding chaperone